MYMHKRYAKTHPKISHAISSRYCSMRRVVRVGMCQEEEGHRRPAGPVVDLTYYLLPTTYYLLSTIYYLLPTTTTTTTPTTTTNNNNTTYYYYYHYYYYYCYY